MKILLLVLLCFFTGAAEASTVQVEYTIRRCATVNVEIRGAPCEAVH